MLQRHLEEYQQALAATRGSQAALHAALDRLQARGGVHLDIRCIWVAPEHLCINTCGAQLAGSSLPSCGRTSRCAPGRPPGCSLSWLHQKLPYRAGQRGHRLLPAWPTCGSGWSR